MRDVPIDADAYSRVIASLTDDELGEHVAAQLARVERLRSELDAWQAAIEASGRQLPPPYDTAVPQARAEFDAMAETLHQIIRSREVRHLDALLKESP